MERYLEFILNHYILSLAMAVVTFLLIQEFADTVFKKFKYISPTLAVLKMNQENVVILDVRESTEFIQGHIEHALNVPLSKDLKKRQALCKPIKIIPYSLHVKQEPGSRSRQNSYKNGH
jgi:rhodanese-related sulfurtransferase